MSPIQIGEDEMVDRQIVLGNLWVAALGNGKVFIPALAEAGISTPIVSDGQRPRSNGALHEPTKQSALRSGTTASLTRPA